MSTTEKSCHSSSSSWGLVTHRRARFRRTVAWQPTEANVFSITATLAVYKREDDSDYHLVISDGNGRTMITEIANPQCVGAGSPPLPGIHNARAGVGFFDWSIRPPVPGRYQVELHELAMRAPLAGMEPGPARNMGWVPINEVFAS